MHVRGNPGTNRPAHLFSYCLFSSIAGRGEGGRTGREASGSPVIEAPSEPENLPATTFKDVLSIPVTAGYRQEFIVGGNEVVRSQELCMLLSETQTATLQTASPN